MFNCIRQMHVRRVVAFVILSDDVIMITVTHRCTVWRYALLLLVPVILFGCDAADPLTSQVSPVDIDSTSALKVHPLSFTEILRTHPDVLPTWEDRADQGDADARTPAEMDDVHLRAPYVCVISSPNLMGQGGPDARYRYDGVVLNFAPAVLATARSMSSGGGVPTRMIEVRTGAHVNPRHTEAQVLRWARCRVPDVPGVQDMVTERLGYTDYQPGRVGESARESDVRKRVAQDLREWEGVPIEDRTFAALVRPPGKTITCVPETVCVKRCSTCPPENCVVKGWDCTGVGSGIAGNGTGYDDGGYLGSGPIPVIYEEEEEVVPLSTFRGLRLSVDYAMPDTIDIDCSDPKGWMAAAHCAYNLPTSSQNEKITSTLADIASHGGECSNIADVGESLLKSGDIRVYPQNVHPDAGGGYSHGGAPVYISDLWFSISSNSNLSVRGIEGEVVELGLDVALVHEIEHHLGRPHIGINGRESSFTTPNLMKCTDQ